jgi:predicted permease
MVGVLVVLLIACDDIAILLMARITVRQREMGIRLALGANRAQLVRQLVAENLMLAALGGMGAMVFALLSARAFEHLPLQLPIPDSYRLTMDWRVLLFTTVTALATTLFFGLRPALQCASKDVVASINPGAFPGSRSSRIRSSLITTQVTVCTALLITAAVLVRSTQSSLSDYRGFTVDHVLLGSINFMGSGYDREMQRSFYETLMTRLNETPGIVAACVADSLPIALPAGDFFRFGGFFGRYIVRSDSRSEEVQVSTNAVSGGHFATLRIPLIEGRDFTQRDDTNSPKVGIINEAMARRMWPTENPIGRILRGEDGETIEVIGVAGNIRYEGKEQGVTPLLYRPVAQRKGLLPNTILVRTDGEPMLAAALLQAKIGEIDPNLLAYNLHTLKDRLARTLLPYRVFAYAAGIPGVFTLLLGVIGTYGTMALVVSQRRREIGIRMALGAHPSRAVALMTKQGMKWTSAGLFLGIIGALFIALWLSRNFYGLPFFDPVAFSVMTLLVAGVAGMASYIPARRASRLDPLKVLRED